MQIPPFLETKFVSRVKTFQILVFILALAACGQRKDDPPAPCQAGVNGAGCSLKIKERSTWSTQLTSYMSDPQTKKPIPGSERKITVSYEFAPPAAAATSNPVWRRMMIIESKDGNTGMFQQGEIKSLSANKIEFITQQSSCDDHSGIHVANTDFTLYYTRTGGSLQLDTSVIQPKKLNGIGDIFGNIIGQAVVDIFRSALESAFSFGSASAYLTSGHGSFSLDPSSPAQKTATKNVTLGCFTTLGTGFSKSAIPMSW